MKRLYASLCTALIMVSAHANPPTPAQIGPQPTPAYPEQTADYVWDIPYNNQDYRVFVKVIGKAPATGYPVMYLLDGNALFDSFSQQRATLPTSPMILVAVGYPISDKFDFTRRAWDYTPPQEDGSPDPDPLKPERNGGGAEQFYDWLSQTLKPRIATQWQVNPQRQAIYGHSYGALFALHTLLRHTDAFTDWIIVSPALWRSGPQIEQGLTQFAATAHHHRSRVLLLSGANEQTGREAVPERAALAAKAPTFAAIQTQLRAQPDVMLTTELIHGKNHGAMIDTGLIRGLSWFEERHDQ
jgi:predicted alpha/beta superfamily hydrolase